VQNFAADLAIVTNSGATIDKIDISTAGALPYPPLVERMDRALATLWRGADLSTMSARTPNAGQGASLQLEEITLLEDDDTQLISETLNMQVDKFVIEYTFGAGTKPLAYFKLKTTQKKNVDQEMKVDEFLLASGAPLGKQNTLERYNRPMPDTDEELLKILPAAPVPAVPPGQNAGGDPGSPLGKKRDPASPVSAGSLSNAEARSQDSEVSSRAGDGVVSGQRSDPSSASSPSSAVRRLSSDSPQVGRLLASARMELAAAQDTVLQPLRAELEAILQSPDSDLQAKIANLKSKMPALLRRINADPATVKVFEDTLSAALLSGLTETL
jgi:hypothetical protein